MLKSQRVRDSFKRTCPSSVNQDLFKGESEGSSDISFERSSDRRVSGCKVIASKVLNQASTVSDTISTVEDKWIKKLN